MSVRDVRDRELVQALGAQDLAVVLPELIGRIGDDEHRSARRCRHLRRSRLGPRDPIATASNVAIRVLRMMPAAMRVVPSCVSVVMRIRPRHVG